MAQCNPFQKNKNKVRFHLWNDCQPCSNYSNETHFFIAYFFYANGIIKYTWMCAVIFSFLFLHSAPNIANTCIAFVLSWWWLWSFIVFWQSKFKALSFCSLVILLKSILCITKAQNMWKIFPLVASKKPLTREKLRLLSV